MPETRETVTPIYPTDDGHGGVHGFVDGAAVDDPRIRGVEFAQDAGTKLRLQCGCVFDLALRDPQTCAHGITLHADRLRASQGDHTP